MKLKKDIVFTLLILLFSTGIVFAEQNFTFRYFEDKKAFEKEFFSVVNAYEDAQNAFIKAQNGMSKTCNQKLQTRCKYIQDKVMDMENMDASDSLFCKQVVCYNAYGSYLENIGNPFNFETCNERDQALDLCVRGVDHRRDNFIRLGMREGETYMIPPKAPFYKIQQMIEAQNLAYDAGFSKEEAQEIVYQLNVENGTWSPTRMGDQWCMSKNGKEDYCFKLQRRGLGVEKILYSCSFGLVQYNTCIHANMTAEEFIADPANKIWLDSRYQMKRLIDFLVAKKAEYGNFKQAQVHWNYPAAAKNGTYRSVAYYNRLKDMKEKFQSPKDAMGAIEITIAKKGEGIIIGEGDSKEN